MMQDFPQPKSSPNFTNAFNDTDRTVRGGNFHIKIPEIPHKPISKQFSIFQSFQVIRKTVGGSHNG